MAAPPRRSTSMPQECHDSLREGGGLLDLGMVAGCLDQLKTRPGNEGAVGATIVWLHDPVAGAPQHEGRNRDTRQPAPELGIVQVGIPGVETERVAIAGMAHQRIVLHGVVVRRPAPRIVPAPAPYLRGSGVEHVEDVGGLAVADLDAHGIDEDELLEPIRAAHGHLGGEPAAERQAHERDLLERQPLQRLQIESYEVVHGVEVIRTWRMTETWMRGRDDLGVGGQEVEHARLGIERGESVEDDQGWTGSATQDLEIYPVQAEP